MKQSEQAHSLPGVNFSFTISVQCSCECNWKLKREARLTLKTLFGVGGWGVNVPPAAKESRVILGPDVLSTIVLRTESQHTLRPPSDHCKWASNPHGAALFFVFFSLLPYQSITTNDNFARAAINKECSWSYIYELSFIKLIKEIKKWNFNEHLIGYVMLQTDRTMAQCWTKGCKFFHHCSWPKMAKMQHVGGVCFLTAFGAWGSSCSSSAPPAVFSASMLPSLENKGTC